MRPLPDFCIIVASHTDVKGTAAALMKEQDF